MRQDNRKEMGLKSMQAKNLHAVTGFVNCAFLFVGGQWFGKTSVNDVCVFLAARRLVQEDGGHVYDGSHVHVVLSSSGFNSFSGWFQDTKKITMPLG